MMEKYEKQNQIPEEHNENIKKRIMNLTETAGVDYNEYIRALGTSKTGYSVIQKRDLDEIYIIS